MKNQEHKFCVAPMMDWTDRHCRAFHRGLSQRALLYTEMVTADAVIFGDRERLLAYSRAEHPLALQLGGSNPEKLREAARIGVEFGYDEINLNVGCPSDRVQEGRFGACLMRDPDLVADCLSAMKEGAGDAPVTVKHRLGVDDDDPATTLPRFVERIARAGVNTFIIHARKAILAGLSPKQNREAPPLDYDLAATIKRNHRDLIVVLNGGVESLDAAVLELNRFDGVMLGRAAYHRPAILLDVDRRIYGEATADRGPVAAALAHRAYLLEQLANGAPLHTMTRHMLGLFHGAPGARAWRRILSEGASGARGKEAIAIYDQAIAAVQSHAPVSAELV